MASTAANGAFDPFWAAMTLNMLLAFGGAFETITTGVTLAARRSIEGAQLRRLLDQEMVGLSDAYHVGNGAD
ncbi:MAG: hypothetical protein AAF654_04385 [Myxococcota bacterium]